MTNIELHNAIIKLVNKAKLNPIEIYGVISAIEAITRVEMLGWVREEAMKREKEKK